MRKLGALPAPVRGEISLVEIAHVRVGLHVPECPTAGEALLERPEIQAATRLGLLDAMSDTEVNQPIDDVRARLSAE